LNLGRYELLERVGEGGSGTVFRARGPDGKTVAIKVIRHRDPAVTARFERERRLLATLGLEAGFVPLLDSGTTPDGMFIVMPFLEGGTLRARFKGGPLSIEETIALGKTLSKALGAAHARGIVHRDVKPENVLFHEGRPLVSDLGTAKHFDRNTPGASQSVALTQAGAMRGTAGYMAPEQMEDSKDVGPAADVFAIGAILHECLTGEPAFRGNDILTLFARVAEGNREPIERPDAPAWLLDTIERAVSADPEDRFADANELLATLEKPPERSGAPVTLVAFAGAAAVVAGIALAAALRSPSPPAKPEVPAIAPTKSAGSALPDWFLALAQKPELPLPSGLRFGAAPGEYVNERDGSVLVFVPGGPCDLGGTANGTSPVRKASVPAFFIGKYEVRNKEWKKFAAAGYKTLSETEGESWHLEARPKTEVPGFDYKRFPGLSWSIPFPDGKPCEDEEPVVHVTWTDAAAYAKWANLVLPLEDQWEKAASWDPIAQRQLRVAWGDGSWENANLKSGHPSRAGMYANDRAPCGAMDMTGNVQEWCGDTNVEVDVSPETKKHLPPDMVKQPGYRVAKGGSWETGKDEITLAHHWVMPGDTVRDTRTGFRIAFDPKKK
jgi:formylglycine-generating enzyme required for sulfatase activity